MANIRVTPTDYTDSAVLWLDAAAALLCQLGNATEADTGTPVQRAAAVYQVQQFLQQASRVLLRDTLEERDGDTFLWHRTRHNLDRISASLEMFRLGLVGDCDLSADRITRAAFYGLMLSTEQARDVINATVAGED